LQGVTTENKSFIRRKITLAFRRVLRYRLGGGDVAAKTCEDEMGILKVNKGIISLDIASMLELFPAAEKRALAESLSCDSDIFDHVAAQIISGWTENDHRGGVGCEAESSPCYGIDKAWRDVAKASSEVARREIERLEAALSASEKRYRAECRASDDLRETLRKMGRA